MNGNVLRQVLHHPLTESADLILAVVVSGDHQIREFQVDALLEHDLRGPEHIVQMGTAHLHVEVVGESLDVYVHGLGDPAQLPQGFLADQSVGDKDQVQFGVTCHHVHDVLEPDHGFVVGERNYVLPLAPAQ